MSIIHDALKKVQDNFQRKPAANDGQQPPEKEKKKFSPFNALMALILLVAAFYFGYNQLLKHWDRIRMAFDLPNVKLNKIEIPKVTISTSTTEKKPRTLSENKATPVPIAQVATETEEKLNIQGILSQGGKTVALINDKIYEEGDELGSIKILTIDSASISILRNGKEENVRVRP